jgi:glycosyl transferase family 25
MSEIPIYVINLDRAPERLAHAEKELAGQGLSLHRVPAVDGAALGEAEVARVYDANASRAAYHVPMQRGEIGCFLSHRRAWEVYLRESAAPFAVILEDDAAFRGPLSPVLAALHAANLPPWDIIKLWATKKRFVRDVAALGSGGRLVREPVISKRTVGQIVSRAGAARLLARTLPIRRPIDVQLQYPWELGIEVLTIQPSLVVDIGEKLFGSSTTKAVREPGSGAKLKREVKRVLLQADLVARSLAHFAR